MRKALKISSSINSSSVSDANESFKASSGPGGSWKSMTNIAANSAGWSGICEIWYSVCVFSPKQDARVPSAPLSSSQAIPEVHLITAACNLIPHHQNSQGVVVSHKESLFVGKKSQYWPSSRWSCSMSVLTEKNFRKIWLMKARNFIKRGEDMRGKRMWSKENVGCSRESKNCRKKMKCTSQVRCRWFQNTTHASWFCKFSFIIFPKLLLLGNFYAVLRHCHLIAPQILHLPKGSSLQTFGLVAE